MKTITLILTLAAASMALLGQNPFDTPDKYVRSLYGIGNNPQTYPIDRSSPTGLYADLTKYSLTCGYCPGRSLARGLTLEIWIRMFADSVKTTGDIILMHYTANLWELKVSNDGTRLLGRICDGQVSSNPIPLHTMFGSVQSDNMLDGLWHLAAMTAVISQDRTHYIVKFYVDGILISTHDLVPPSVTWGPSDTLIVGGVRSVPSDPRNFAEPGFPGHFCAEVVSDTERTAAYILEHFTRFRDTISIGYSAVEAAASAPAISITSWPEPFNTTVSFRFSMKRTEAVVLQVFDIRGKAVATPFVGKVAAGAHTMVWNGNGFSTGAYIYKVSIGSNTKSGTINLLR